MKVSQSSVYRELENLLLWFIPVGNNFPKDFALRGLGERMRNNALCWSMVSVRAIPIWDSWCIMPHTGYG